MPRPIKVKLRAGNPISVSMENDFTQDSSITEEKVFDNSESDMILSRIVISGPLEGYPSPLVIHVTNSQEDLTVSVEYQPNPSQGV